MCSSDLEFPFDASAAFRRGEFDAVLALGPVDGIEEAHGSPAAGVEIVAIDAVATRLVSRGVHLRCRDLSDTPGSVVRADGTTLALPGSPCDRPSVGDLLRSLHAEVAAGRGGSR